MDETNDNRKKKIIVNDKEKKIFISLGEKNEKINCSSFGGGEKDKLVENDESCKKKNSKHFYFTW